MGSIVPTIEPGMHMVHIKSSSNSPRMSKAPLLRIFSGILPANLLMRGARTYTKTIPPRPNRRLALRQTLPLRL